MGRDFSHVSHVFTFVHTCSHRFTNVHTCSHQSITGQRAPTRLEEGFYEIAGLCHSGLVSRQVVKTLVGDDHSRSCGLLLTGAHGPWFAAIVSRNCLNVHRAILEKLCQDLLVGNNGLRRFTNRHTHLGPHAIIADVTLRLPLRMLNLTFLGNLV